MTLYTIGIDFSGSGQAAILKELQDEGYSLVGFKGAVGLGQIKSGVPAWFSVPFSHIFGAVEIDYEPQYKVFIYQQAQIAAQTDIKMHSLSTAMDLGNSVTFTQTGGFTSGGIANMQADSIGVHNDCTADTPAVTVGLAGLVNTPTGRQYAPFCAFNLRPQSSISMRPLEQVLLLAAQLDLSSGNVQATLAAPGVLFQFSAKTPNYPLLVQDGSLALAAGANGAPVKPVDSGQAVNLVNKPL